MIKIPASKKQFSIDVNVSDTVSGLKERIHQAESILVTRFALLCGGNELQLENWTLGEYHMSDGSELSVHIKSHAAAVAASSGSKKMRVMVLLQSGKKVSIEVNPTDSARELRRELQKLQLHQNFSVPGKDYFFIFRQNVMDEDRSFRSNEARPGDTIEAFKGSVTGGAS